MPDVPPVGQPSFWDDLYARGQDGWELGGPAPALVDLVESAPPPRGRVAVPGCGRGHDVRFLAARGWEARGFDFSAAAIAEARRLTPADSTARFEQQDLFNLPSVLPGYFDWAWEYTCFCAIDPARRADYVDVIRRILRPGGELAALFYPLRTADRPAPPFPVSRGEVEGLLAAHFDVLSAGAPLRSVPRREGEELLVRARLRG